MEPSRAEASDGAAPQATVDRQTTSRGASKLKDSLFVAFYIAHTALVALLLSLTPSSNGLSAASTVYGILVSCVLLSALAGSAWARLVYNRSTDGRAQSTFVAAQATALATLSLLVALLFTEGFLLLGSIAVSAIIADIAWLRLDRERLGFMGEILSFVCEANGSPVTLRPLVKIVLLAQALMAAFCLYWIWAITCAIRAPTAVGVPLLLLLALSLRWTSGTAKNVVTYAVSGTVTSWLSAKAAQASVSAGSAAQVHGVAGNLEGSGGESVEGEAATNGSPAVAPAALPPPPSPSALARRAIGRSLGTVLASSLLGLLSPLAWPGLRVGRWLATMRRPWIARIGRFLHALCRSYLRQSHKYALVSASSTFSSSVLLGQPVTHAELNAHPNTSGMGWFAHASRVWSHLHRGGVEAVLDDDVSDRMIVTCCAAAGGSASFLAGLWLLRSGSDVSGLPWTWAVGAVAAGWMAYVFTSIPLSLLEGGVSAIIVTYAEAPEVLALAHPVIHHRFTRLAEAQLLRTRARRTGAYF